MKTKPPIGDLNPLSRNSGSDPVVVCNSFCSLFFNKHIHVSKVRGSNLQSNSAPPTPTIMIDIGSDDAWKQRNRGHNLHL